MERSISDSGSASSSAEGPGDMVTTSTTTSQSGFFDENEGVLQLFTFPPSTSLSPPTPKGLDEDNLPLVIGLSAAAGVGLIITIIIIVCVIRRRSTLKDPEKAKTTSDTEPTDYNQNRPQRGTENLERLSKMKRNTRNPYETTKRQDQEGACNFTPQTSHNEEEEENFEKYLIEDEYDKHGHEKVSPNKAIPIDCHGYSHLPEAPSGKMIKQGKDLAKYTVNDERGDPEYEDLIAEEDSHYELANSDLYHVPADVKTIEDSDNPYSLAKGEEDTEYAEIPNIADDVYDIAADVKTGGNDVIGKDIGGIRGLAEDVKPVESPYTLAKGDENPYELAEEETADHSSQGTKDSSNKAMDKASEECQNDLPENVVAGKLEDPYTMADAEERKTEYDSFGNNVEMSKLGTSYVDENGYDHFIKIPGEGKMVDISAEIIQDERSAIQGQTTKESPYSLTDHPHNDFPEEAKPYNLPKDENPYDLPKDDNPYDLPKDDNPYDLAKDDNPYDFAQGEDPHPDNDKIYENDDVQPSAKNSVDLTYDIPENVHHSRFNGNTSDDDPQETDLIDDTKEPYYNTSEVSKHARVNGQSELPVSASVKNENYSNEKEESNGTNLVEGADSPLNMKKRTGNVLFKENSLYDRGPDKFPKLDTNESYDQADPTNNRKVKVRSVENTLYEKTTI